MVTIDGQRACAGTTRAGKPCGSQVLCDGTHCYVHAPGREQERAEARRRGGEGRAAVRRAQRMMPTDLQPVFTTLASLLDDVIAGRMEPKQATAAATVARA